MVEPERFLANAGKNVVPSLRCPQMIKALARDKAIQRSMSSTYSAYRAHDMEKRRQKLKQDRLSMLGIEDGSKLFRKVSSKYETPKEDVKHSESAPKLESKHPSSLALWNSSMHGFRYRANGEERLPLSETDIQNILEQLEFEPDSRANIVNVKRHLLDAVMIHSRDVQGGYFYNNYFGDIVWKTPRVPRFGNVDHQSRVISPLNASQSRIKDSRSKNEVPSFLRRENQRFYHDVLEQLKNINEYSSSPGIKMTSRGRSLPRVLSEPLRQQNQYYINYMYHPSYPHNLHHNLKKPGKSPSCSSRSPTTKKNPMSRTPGGGSFRNLSKLRLSQSVPIAQSMRESVIPKHSFHQRYGVPLQTLARRKSLLDQCKLNEKETEAKTNVRIQRFIQDVNKFTEAAKKRTSKQKKSGTFDLLSLLDNDNL